MLMLNNNYLLLKGGFLKSEMAWERFPKTSGETALVCKEMMNAVSLIQDAISNEFADEAKECFIALYEKHVRQSIKANEQCVWFVSLGDDESLKQQWLTDMIGVNALSLDEAKGYGYID